MSLGHNRLSRLLRMKMTKCGLCGSNDFSIEYDGPIRDGDFGKETETSHKVVKCSSCGLVRLLENSLSIQHYQSNAYREAYNSTSNPDDYIMMHDSEQPPRINKIGISNFRDKVVLDYGCGGGAFLDQIMGVAKCTYGIEPFVGYHASLSDRGHEIFADSESALSSYKNKIDTIVSFGVLEHVEDPLSYLSTAYELLVDGGKMYLETDNLDDILMKLGINEFQRFFYRTAHLWYFDSETLNKIVKKSGFSDMSIYFRHNFDLSNMIMWLRDRVPTGIGKSDFFDKRLNNIWEGFIESAGFSDLVCIEITKS